MSDLNSMKKGWIFNEEWGFGGVAPEEKACECWGRALLSCANGDGELTPEERNWVLGYSAINGVSPEHIEMLRTYEANEDITQILSEALREGVSLNGTERALVYDLIRVCAADGDITAGERDTVYKMAELLGVGRETVDLLEVAYYSEVAAKKTRWKIAYPQPLF